MADPTLNGSRSDALQADVELLRQWIEHSGPVDLLPPALRSQSKPAAVARVLEHLDAVEARAARLAGAVRAEASDGRGVGGRLAAALAAYEAGGAGDDLLARAEAAEADADRLAAALTYVLKRFSDTPNFDLLLPEGGPDESALRLHDEAVACGTPPGAAT